MKFNRTYAISDENDSLLDAMSSASGLNKGDIVNEAISYYGEAMGYPIDKPFVLVNKDRIKFRKDNRMFSLTKDCYDKIIYLSEKYNMKQSDVVEAAIQTVITNDLTIDSINAKES